MPERSTLHRDFVLIGRLCGSLCFKGLAEVITLPQIRHRCAWRPRHPTPAPNWCCVSTTIGSIGHIRNNFGKYSNICHIFVVILANIDRKF